MLFPGAWTSPECEIPIAHKRSGSLSWLGAVGKAEPGGTEVRMRGAAYVLLVVAAPYRKNNKRFGLPKQVKDDAPYPKRGKRFGLPEQVKADGADTCVQNVLEEDVHAWMESIRNRCLSFYIATNAFAALFECDGCKISIVPTC